MAEPSSAAPSDAFYCRYYVGHRGKFGHEFLEFEFRPDGKVWSKALSRVATTLSVAVAGQVVCRTCSVPHLLTSRLSAPASCGMRTTATISTTT
jgi:hypothetical protein